MTKGKALVGVFCALIISPLLAAELPPRLRLTSDKKTLPDAVPRSAAIKLPIVGTKLDALPEEACGKVWELDTDIQFVNDFRHVLTDDGVDLSGFNYMGDGIGGFSKTVLDVENGRVRKMILFRPGLTDAVASSTMAKMAADTQERPTKGKKGDAVLFRVKGVHFYEKIVGRWSETIAGEHHPKINGGSDDTPDAHLGGPAGIEIGIEDDDWQALNVCTDPAMLKAIQDEKLVKGMRPVEAYLAMKSHRLYRQKVGDKYVWTWTDKKVDVQDYYTVSDEFGGSTTIHYASTEHPFARVTFANGLVDVIETEDTMLAPPAK